MRKKRAKLITGVDGEIINASLQPFFLMRQTPVADALSGYLTRTAACVTLLVELPDLLPAT